ncbi:response regulator transcription factor [Pedobacter namyangjuensis]|uniref:response regulator transcription factor n=1 Tax=Pedobacter namyangjuensis TaxID=600626 RepID=UPI000DE1BC6B|nr:response regulator [Pedobacter namyangjuensis]
MDKKIYVVEDNDDIRELVTYLLESEGYGVDSFATVKAFEERKDKDLPTLFLLDVMLPDGNGMTICEKLKDDEQSATIPVLLMSAHKDVAFMRKESRADDFIAKPFDIDALVKKVNDLIA